MKKLAVGCLVILGLGMLAGAVGMYFLYRAARPAIEGAGEYLARARELTVLGDRLANRNPFTGPADGALGASQVVRLLAVQRAVQQALGARWAELQQAADELSVRLARDPANVSLADLASVLTDAADVYVQARRAQVDALNAQNFSAEEYAWVRRRVYEAAGVHLAGSIDFTALERAIREGGGVDVRTPAIALPEVPPGNLALVAPHVKELKERIALVVLGL